MPFMMKNEGHYKLLKLACLTFLSGLENNRIIRIIMKCPKVMSDFLLDA